MLFRVYRISSLPELLVPPKFNTFHLVKIQFKLGTLILYNILHVDFRISKYFFKKNLDFLEIF